MDSYRHYIVTIPSCGRPILTLDLKAGRCLPREVEIHAGNGELFDRAARTMGLIITHRDDALSNPKAYGRRVSELLGLFRGAALIVLAYPPIVTCLDGAEPGVSEAIYFTEAGRSSFRGLTCCFRKGQPIATP